jgi:hypothetical protein
LEYDGECLDRLAQPHVIGEAGANAEVGQARQPLETFHLVVTQLGFEGGWHGRRPLQAFGNILQAFVPGRVGIQVGELTGEILEGQGRQGVQTDAVATGFGVDLQLLQSLLRRSRVRRETALRRWERSACGLLEQVQQLLHIQRQAVIQLQMAAHFEPVGPSPGS